MLTRLMRLEAVRRPWSLAVLALVVAMMTAAIVVWSQVGDWALEAVARGLRGGDAERRLHMLPPPTAGIDLSHPHFSSEDLAALAALDGCQRLTPVWEVPLPASLAVSLPGVIESEQFLALYAVDVEAVPESARTAWTDPDGPCPLLINPQVAALYNTGFAARYGLPRIGPEMLRSLALQLSVGADAFRALPGALVQPARVVGFSDEISLWGVAVPRARAVDWVAALSPADPAFAPVSVWTVWRDGTSLAAARAFAADYGWSVGDEMPLVRLLARARAGVRATLVVAALLAALAVGLIVAVLALVVISERAAAQRRYLAQGASWLQLAVVFGAGHVVVSALAAVIGVGLAAGLSAAVAGPVGTMIGQQLPAAAPLPSLAAVAWWWWLSAPAVAVAAAGVGVVVAVSRRPSAH
ncbi:MAG: hypothetical protein ACYTF0_03810 [Planctomycetota bacterium]|jgi:hypothetical protein